MFGTIAFLSFVGVLVFLVLALVSVFKKSGKGKKNLKIAGICFVVTLIAGTLAPDAETASTDTKEKEKTEEPTKKEKTEEEKKAEEEAAAKKKAEEEAAAKAEAEKKVAEEKAKAEEDAKKQTPEYRLNQAVVKAIGKDKDKLVELTYDATSQNVFVKFKGDDNLTANFIITGIQSDIKDILKNVKESEVPFNDINVVTTFPMVDQYGNESESDVIDLLYSKVTVDKINFDNFLTDNVYTVADIKAFIHPEFIKE